ncbi:hypothetical protein DW767_08450 [Blautia obeum]|uniref:DUF308 domain-containing protein n=1 Tax=Blautia obeum TaxID=40520 RepID=A0A396FV11_9FIRM|nr:DUF308 domain-containing protein [Blautia obeum]RGI91870.1 hypothetical protein DXD81_09395 [Blautia obeum]RHE12383.1 hypothetical protein DW767_08450 [Blautia obeum]RHM27875.1 hypothetical protein DWZ74_10525 [Blautia obeum]
MWEKINNFLKGQIVTSIIYIALGACLVFMPVSTVNVICKFVFGILLILVGLYHILIYVAEKLNSTIFDLFSGGVLMVLGIFLFMNPQIVVKLLPILLGTFILVDSIWSLKGSLKLKKRGAGSWKFLLLGSIIFIALGISLVVNPFTMVKYTVIFAGWIFLCNGVIDMIYLILLRKGLKEIKQDVEAVDADGEIISGEDSGETDDLDTEASVQPEEPIALEPEYAPWSSRKKEKSTETDIPGFTEEEKEDNATSGQEDFGTEEADREVSEMEKSLDDVQANEDDASVDGVTDTITGQDNDTPPAGRGAYVVSKPTITDDNLSDTKDESLLGMFSRKHKHNKKEN